MPTRTQLRRALLERIGGGGVYTTDGNGNVGGSTLICASGFKSSLLPSSHLKQAWLYAPLATFPRQRRIASIAGGSGTITLEEALGQQINSGFGFEISSLLPLDQDTSAGTGQSLNQIITESIRHQNFPDEISLSITTGDEYSLSTWSAWLDRPSRLLKVLEPAPMAGRAPIDSSFRGWDLILDGEMPKLRCKMPFSVATGSLTLSALRPGDSWLNNAGGGWVESTAVLLDAETDEVRLPLADVVEGALPFAYAAIAQSRSGQQREEYFARARDALANARRLATWDRTRDTLPEDMGASTAPPLPAPAAGRTG